jgi:hypothetical protein
MATTLLLCYVSLPGTRGTPDGNPLSHFSIIDTPKSADGLFKMQRSQPPAQQPEAYICISQYTMVLYPSIWIDQLHSPCALGHIPLA